LSINDGDENAFAALEEALKNAAPQDAAPALAVLQQAYNANPSSTSLLELLTDTQIRTGRTEEAAKMLRDSAARLGQNDKAAAANILAKLGSIYAEAGRDAEAIAAYEDSLKALDIGTTPLVTEIERSYAGQILPRMVAVYRNTGQTAKAKETINRLTALLGKSDSSADEQLIELLRSTGDREAALTAVRDARKRFPEDQSLTVLEANVLTEMGKVDEGVDLLRSKIVNKPKQISVPSSLRDDFFAYITISNLYTQAGRGVDAVASAQLAVDLSVSPQMTTIATVNLATAQNAAGDFKSAEASLREVLKTEPNNATALNNLGYFLTERGERLPEAIEMIKKAVEREPNNASFLDSLGWAYFKQGQLAEAEKYLTEAARRNPNSAAIQNHLGDLYQKQGKTDQAKTAWRKALNLSKQPTEIEKIRKKLGGK
jgi:predicted Zn-dependent protease